MYRKVDFSIHIVKTYIEKSTFLYVLITSEVKQVYVGVVVISL